MQELMFLEQDLYSKAAIAGLGIPQNPKPSKEVDLYKSLNLRSKLKMGVATIHYQMLLRKIPTELKDESIFAIQRLGTSTLVRLIKHLEKHDVEYKTIALGGTAFMSVKDAVKQITESFRFPSVSCEDNMMDLYRTLLFLVSLSRGSIEELQSIKYIASVTKSWEFANLSL